MNTDKLAYLFIGLILMLCSGLFAGYLIGKGNWTPKVQEFYTKARAACIDVEPDLGKLEFVNSLDKGLFILCRRDLK